MTNLGLRITLPCIEKEKQNNQRILFAFLNCRRAGEDKQLGIWLNEAASGHQPLGRFARAYLDTWAVPEDDGSRKRKAKVPKPTTLYIIQPYFRSGPEPEEEDGWTLSLFVQLL